MDLEENKPNLDETSPDLTEISVDLEEIRPDLDLTDKMTGETHLSMEKTNFLVHRWLDWLRSQFLCSNPLSDPPLSGFGDKYPPPTVTGIRWPVFGPGWSCWAGWAGARSGWTPLK